jgi:hypothetical protein
MELEVCPVGKLTVSSTKNVLLVFNKIKQYTETCDEMLNNLVFMCYSNVG